MTATVKIIIRKIEHSLKVPNAALRFKPALSELESKAALAGIEQESEAWSGGPLVLIWVLRADGTLHAVPVQLGMTDGISTQIVSGAIKEGDTIVTGIESGSKSATTSSSNTRTPGFGGPGMGGMPPPPPR